MNICSINAFIGRKNTTRRDLTFKASPLPSFGKVQTLEIPQSELDVYSNKSRQEFVDSLMWMKNLKTQELGKNA
jgi:hypothetical protein